MKKVAILGGGNGAHAAAADLTLRGYKVNMFELPSFAKASTEYLSRTPFARLVDTGGIHVDGPVMEGFAKLNMVTENIEKAIKDVKLIFIVITAFGIKDFVDTMAPHLEDGQIIVKVGKASMSPVLISNLLKEKKVKKDVKICETNSLPYVVRLKFGLSGNVTIWSGGKDSELKVGSFPGKDVDEIMRSITEFYPKWSSVSSCLEVFIHGGAAHVAGTILNAGRIEELAEKYDSYKDGQTFIGEFSLYRNGFMPSVINVVLAADKEVASICKALGYSHTPYYEWLLHSHTPIQSRRRKLTAKSVSDMLRTHPIITPTYLREPDSLKDRYLTEDVPYCLVLQESIADMLGVPCPTIKALIHLASLLNQTDYRKEGITLQTLGLSGITPEELKKYLIEGSL